MSLEKNDHGAATAVATDVVIAARHLWRHMGCLGCCVAVSGVPSTGNGLSSRAGTMAGPTLWPRQGGRGHGDTFTATSAAALTEYLARDQPVAGRVLTVCAEDMAQWVGSNVNDQPLWLVDGSGTVKEHGPIQCGLVLYERGNLLQTHSAAFMPGGGLLGTWKTERFHRGGEQLQREMEISSSAVEELCLAWALDFHIGHMVHESSTIVVDNTQVQVDTRHWLPTIVVDNMHWLPALCGIADPSPTTTYSRSILAECVCRQGGCFLLRHAVPCMGKQVWGSASTTLHGRLTRQRSWLIWIIV